MSRAILVLAVLVATSVARADQKPAAPPSAKPADPAAPAAPAADDPWSGRADLFVPPAVKPSTQVELGPVQRFTLPNGLQVIAVPRHHAPAIDVVLAVRVDDAVEPVDKAGLVQFVASMLRKGTQRRTSDRIADEIDFAGGTIEAANDEGATMLGCRGRAQSLALCLDLVADLASQATFPEAEMGEIRDQLLAVDEGMRDQPNMLADAHAANLYFGDGDSRGRPASKRSIQAIDRATLIAFHAAWYRPNNAVLAISGDFDPKTLRAGVTKWFGAWKSAPVAPLPERALPPAGPLKVRLVDKPDATQAHLTILGPGIRHAAADLCATRLMNYTLGEGTFSSRLMKVVRSDSGKTYGASSIYETHREPGFFSAKTFTREPEVPSTLKLVLGEIERMRERGPTAEELRAAKANLIGGYGLKFETGADVARQLLVAEIDHLPATFALDYPRCLDAVTLADAAQAAAAHLSPQALAVVGNAKALAPLLAAAKLAAAETVGYTEPVSAAERKAAAEAREQAKREALRATPAEVEEGKKLLALALKAKGADGIARIADLHVNGTGAISAGGQNLPIGFEGFYAPGRAQREDVTLMGQTMSQVFVDGKAFAKANLVAKELPAAAAAAGRRELWRNPNLVVLNAARPDASVRALPKVVEGKRTYDALMVVSAEGDACRLLFDPQTHQLARVVIAEDGKEARHELSAYKVEGGIAIARHLVSDQEDQHIERTLDKVQINKGLPKDAFAR